VGHRTVRWCTGQVLFTIRCAICACSDFYACSPRIVALSADRCAGDRCSAWHIGQSGATPDSPVNYSGVAPRIPEGGKFGVDLPGAPDTVRWYTEHCPVAQRTVWCARPGQPSVVFCSFYLNPFLDFYWFVLNLWRL
jgi:hypothetical protein